MYLTSATLLICTPAPSTAFYVVYSMALLTLLGPTVAYSLSCKRGPGAGISRLLCYITDIQSNSI